MNTYLSIKLKVISFFSMILVVYLHSSNLYLKSNSENAESGISLTSFFQNFFSEGITRIAVPLFFIISGYLFFLKIDEGGWKEFLSRFRKRINTLIFPYLCWSIWGLTVFIILQSLPHTERFFANKLITDYSVSELLFTLFLNPIPYQLWFVRDLVILIFLSPIIYWLVKYSNYSIVVLLLWAWLARFDFIVVSNEALLFFAAGSFLGIKRRELVSLYHVPTPWIYLIIWMSIVFVKTYLLYTEFPNKVAIDLIHKIGILVGVFAVWAMYDALFRGKDLTTKKFYPILSFSFFLYAFHEPTLTIFKKGLIFIGGKSGLSMLLVYLIAPLLTIIVSVIIGYHLKQSTPRFYKLITGGR